MTIKAFRVDWYPRDAFIDFAALTAEQIGVLMQIINLIYSHNGPVDNDPKYIGKSCNITRSRCRRIISELVTKECLSLTEDGRLTQKRCLDELKLIQERREKYSENGKDGAKKRWRIEDNQEVDNSQAIGGDLASTDTSTSHSKDTNIGSVACQGRLGITTDDKDQSADCGRYNVDYLLSDEARQRARKNAPKWDQQLLMRKYSRRINQGHMDPPRDPDLAYPAWCLKYTKGKPPMGSMQSSKLD